VVSWLETPLILIKSSVPPGTTDALKARYGKRITFSPEYLGESRYYLPELFTPLGWPYLIVGGDRKDTREIVQFFLPRLGPAKTYIQTDPRTAELTKYMENAWLSLQVTFANEFYEIAKAVGVDYTELRELWALDPRVSKYHTVVFPEARGFGGKCLPKDLKAVVAAAQAAGYDPELLKAVWDNNLRFREGYYLGNDGAQRNGVAILPGS
jgi:nucleotide sugar dehydrogenase